MPKTCGSGPYSRIDSFEETSDLSSLPAEHAAALPAGGKVYKVSFDYNFNTIPESNGPVLYVFVCTLSTSISYYRQHASGSDGYARLLGRDCEQCSG
jgi:hypothetical protein